MEEMAERMATIVVELAYMKAGERLARRECFMVSKVREIEKEGIRICMEGMGR